MCGKSRTSPDTSRQEAEAARQRQVEDARFQERLAVETARFDKERADLLAQIEAEKASSDAQAQAQLDAQTAFQNEQLTFQNQLAEEARADRLRELEGNELERSRNQLVEDRRAATARAENEERGRRIDSARDTVNRDFAKFDDNYFSGFADKFIGSKQPGIDREFEGKQREESFGLARRGILNGSGTARVFSRLAGEKASRESDLAIDANREAQSLRGNIDRSRSAALQAAVQGAQLAPVVLPEGIAEELVPDTGGVMDALRSFRLNPIGSPTQEPNEPTVPTGSPIPQGRAMEAPTAPAGSPAPQRRGVMGARDPVSGNVDEARATRERQQSPIPTVAHNPGLMSNFFASKSGAPPAGANTPFNMTSANAVGSRLGRPVPGQNYATPQATPMQQLKPAGTPTTNVFNRSGPKTPRTGGIFSNAGKKQPVVEGRGLGGGMFGRAQPPAPPPQRSGVQGYRDGPQGGSGFDIRRMRERVQAQTVVR